MQLPEIIESLLFAGQGPLTAEDLARAVREAAEQRGEEDETGQRFAATKVEHVTAAIDELIRCYEESGRAFTLVERPFGWRLATKPDYADWVRGLFPGRKPTRLSPPALETLAIIAYRQPVTKASIEAVRGVAVDGVLQSLLDRHLVRIAGRADLPGRPLLYQTTELFLEHFGIQNVDQLPNAEELRRVPLPEAKDGGDSAQAESIEQPDLPLGEATEPAIADSDPAAESDESATLADQQAAPLAEVTDEPTEEDNAATQPAERVTE